MMLASDSSCGGLEADMAVAVGGSLLDPDGAVAMLRRQACQTDFGGWPISEGALLWIQAAWSAFCATSDTVWLREAYGVAQDIIARSLEVGWDSSLGLLRGSMLKHGAGSSSCRIRAGLMRCGVSSRCR